MFFCFKGVLGNGSVSQGLFKGFLIVFVERTWLFLGPLLFRFNDPSSRG